MKETRQTIPGLEDAMTVPNMAQDIVQHSIVIANMAERIKAAQTTVDALSTAIELMEIKYRELQDSLTDVDALHTNNERNLLRRTNINDQEISRLTVEINLMRHQLKEFKEAPTRSKVLPIRRQ